MSVRGLTARAHPLHRHPRNVTASAHSIHGRTEYPLYRSPHAVPAHIHYTASRTGVPTAPQPSHQRRSGGAHGVAVEPCGTATHAQRNPRACRLSRKVAHLRVLALYHGSSVCLQNAVQFFFFDLRLLTRVMRAAVPIPAVAAASVLQSAAVGGSVVGVVGSL